MVWLLAGIVSAQVAAAEPGRGERRTVRGAWFNKLDRGLQRAVDDGSNHGGERRRVIIRTRAGAAPRGLDGLADKARSRFGLSLVLTPNDVYSMAVGSLAQ